MNRVAMFLDYHYYFWIRMKEAMRKEGEDKNWPKQEKGKRESGKTLQGR